MSVLRPKLLTTLQDYNKNQFLKDITAGIIVAIIALPLSIALAIASGVSPERGLYTAIIAGFLISLLGGSRVQIGGPTGAFMVIVYGIVTEYGLEGLTIATIMAGMIMIAMGFLKFGSVIKFIPYPITTGFTSGIAITIFSSQIKDFFGLEIAEVPAEFIEKWHSYISHFNTLDFSTVIIGILALAILILWPKFNAKIPGALIALIITAVVVNVGNMDVATIGTKFGALSSAPPSFHLPEFSIDKMLLLIGPAFTIAILGSIESLLSAVVADGMIGGKHRSNMELIAQGVANMMSGFFGGIPATGAIARTVANIKNGGRTPIAGMVHATVLLVILVVLMPLAKMIPLASLAAVLIMVAYNMSEWREFKRLLSSPRSDVMVLLLTFFITVLIDLVKAIEVGMILASFLFMKRMAEVTEVNIHSMDAAEEAIDEEIPPLSPLLENVKIYEINGPFFFGAADKFLNALKEIGDHTDILILRMRHVPVIDATAMHAFSNMLNLCNKSKMTLLISGMNEQLREVFQKAGYITLIGEEHIFANVSDALAYANMILEAQNVIK